MFSPQRNPVLHTVNLAYNGLAIPGAIAIADALNQNENLTDLDLTCNRIFDEGAMEIGKALLTNETLRKLRVRSFSYYTQCNLLAAVF